MRKAQNVARYFYLFGMVLALAALSSTVRGQATNVWSAKGPNISISSLAIDPKNSSNVYAATYGGVFKSTDGGASWTNMGLSNATTLAIDFVNPNIVYAGTFSSGVVYAPGGAFLFKSTNGGLTWSNASSPIDFDISLLVMDPSSSNVLYAGSATEAAGAGGIILWKTTNAGATWSGDFTGNIGLYPWGMAINPLNSQILYAPGDVWSTDAIPQVAGSGLYKSADGGSTWAPTGLNNAFIQSVAIDPLSPFIMYAGTSNWTNERVPYRGLLKSTDAGVNWLPINNGLTDLLNARSAVTAIVIDPHNPNVVYVATAGSGVFRTSDSGANWSSLNDGLTSLDVRALALAGDTSHVLYAGTAAGVFRMVDSITLPLELPSDEPQSFVTGQYRDFLNREPDADGLAFWMNEITACGSDAHCVEVKRINVSAAFFLSIEFQQTGYLIYRLYKSSYGNLPGAPVPLTRSEFLPDAQRVGQGVIVNQPGWQTVLENNKQTFASEFVQRARFTSAYPDFVAPAAFVDALFANAGVTPSSTDREAAIGEFGSASTIADAAARARALRRVAENSALVQQEFNRAFVLAQYFGYLRRNPNDAPDSNFDGYNFWLNKLDTFNGNFIEAEMVKAFLSSAEYRHRFGP